MQLGGRRRSALPGQLGGIRHPWGSVLLRM
jgi:hypothetical protein